MRGLARVLQDAQFFRFRAAQELPGEFTTFDFLEGIPAPFNFGLSILLNQTPVPNSLGREQLVLSSLSLSLSLSFFPACTFMMPATRKMLTLPEKLQTAPALLPMLVEGQKFIDLQDELSATWQEQLAELPWKVMLSRRAQVFNFMEKYGMPDRTPRISGNRIGQKPKLRRRPWPRPCDLP